MQLRDHPGCISKRDYYVVDPRTLKTEPGYNVRSLDSPDTREHIDALKESIAANGVRVPLEVRLSGEDIFIVAGHCRHAAVMELIAEGQDIRGVPCIPEAKTVNDAERTLNLALSNSGKPLTTLETAEVVRRLLAFGWSEAEVQKRMRWKSSASVSQHAEVAALPEEVKKHVRDNDISASLATKMMRDEPEKVAELIRANKEENKRLGVGSRVGNRVTPKTLKRAAKMPQAETTLPDPQPESAPPTAPVDVGACLQTIAGIAKPESADKRTNEFASALHDLADEARKVIRAIEVENPSFAFGGFLDAIRDAERLLAQHYARQEAA